jgi:hypothetical protein
MLNSRWRWPAIPITAVSIAGNPFCREANGYPGGNLLQGRGAAFAEALPGMPSAGAPLAQAMKEAVLLKKMPPWFADPRYGKFSNDRSLSQSEVRTLVAWADGGALEGDARDLPEQAAYVEGWSIPKPDVVFEFPQPFQIPVAGTHMHHMILYVREPGSHWLRGEPAWRVMRRGSRRRSWSRVKASWSRPARIL